EGLTRKDDHAVELRRAGRDIRVTRRAWRVVRRERRRLHEVREERLRVVGGEGGLVDDGRRGEVARRAAGGTHELVEHHRAQLRLVDFHSALRRNDRRNVVGVEAELRALAWMIENNRK